MRHNLAGPVVASYSLVGDDTGATITDFGGSLIGSGAAPIDPLLAPLANNGGPTLPNGNVLMTHALLVGSAAIDIGAFEVAAVAAGIPGDGNLDGTVDGLDYILWALNFGDDPADVPPGSPENGDYNDDGAVDGLDYLVWTANFGTSDAPIPGDGNLDGSVDGLDYLIWALHFGDDPVLDPPGSPMNGDFNGDGAVDGLDYLVWTANFGASLLATLAPAEVNAAEVNAAEADAVDAAFAADDRSDSFTSDTHLARWKFHLAFDAVFEDLAVKKNPRHGRR